MFLIRSPELSSHKSTSASSKLSSEYVLLLDMQILVFRRTTYKEEYPTQSWQEKVHHLEDSDSRDSDHDETGRRKGEI